MLKKIPKTCNLHVFSFLSSTETRHARTVNRETKDLLSNPLVWKNLLKNEFFIPDWREIKEPEQKHKALTEEVGMEQEKLITYLTVVLFLLEVKKQTTADNPTLETMYEHKYDRRIYKSDLWLLISFQAFLDNYNELKKNFSAINNRIPMFFEIDKAALKQQIKNFFSGKTNQTSEGKFIEAMIRAPFKLDLPILSRMILNKIKPNKPLLNKLLSIASDFLNLSCAKLLIEFGADINALVLDITPYGEISLLTCLNRPIIGILMQYIDHAEQSIENAKALIQMLLNHSADPDIRCLVIPKDVDIKNISNEEIEKETFSIREFCIRHKEHDKNDIPIEILDLIISAPRSMSDKAEMKTNEDLKQRISRHAC